MALAGGYNRGDLEAQATKVLLLGTVGTGTATATAGIFTTSTVVGTKTRSVGTAGTATVTAFTTSTTKVVTADNGDDIEQWSVGLNVGFAGFTVGASALGSNGGLDSGGDIFTWDAGVTYATGPITVGFTWLTAEIEDGTAISSGGSGDDELDSFVVSGTYNMGPGVDVWGGLKWFDYQDAGNAAAASNEGYIIAIGSSVSF